MKLELPGPGRTEKQVAVQIVQAAAMLGIELKRRNVGMAYNPNGQPVWYGEKGDADWYATLPDGRHLDLEIKHEHFNPSKLTGSKREHFERQLAKLRRTNEQNGVGFWVDDAEEFILIMREVLGGGRVEEPGYDRPIVYRRGAR